ncbi:MAG: hypothetical protein Q9M21_01945 [Mariprofundaceae bacterium]|nr:hypothetical protein [Mariprofundaceae bacterium]
MNKLWMFVLLLGLSSCAMYEDFYEDGADGARMGDETSTEGAASKQPRFDGKDYNDDFGEYDD